VVQSGEIVKNRDVILVENGFRFFLALQVKIV